MNDSQRPQFTTPGQRPALPPTTPHAATRARRTAVLITLLVVLAAVALFTFFYTHHKDNTSTSSNNGANGGQGGFDKTQHSLTDPNSIWVIVNKQRALQPKDYAPTDLVTPDVSLRVPGHESMQLRREAADALEQLVGAAKNAGHDLMLASGYRSYQYQVGLYGGYVQNMGQAAADQTSARPGHSEHQTGLAVDVEPPNRQCELEICFGDLPEGKWVAANAYKYGFIIRYSTEKTDVTGYEYEPWHLRYVGKSLAKELHTNNNETMEEFFGAKGGKDYN